MGNELAPGTTVHGNRPTAGDKPYAHLTTAPWGLSTGFGLGNGPVGPAKDKATAGVMNANLGLGRWQDASGDTNYGIAGDAGVARVGMAPGGALGPIGFDVGALTASANASANSSTAGIGAQANIIEGAVSAGNDEHNVRFGGSVGVGLAGRAHYGDADNDGVRELGFGFDAGPVSFDVRSELLGHAWNGVSNAASWAGDKISGAWDSITSW